VRVELLDYELPESAIAQRPLARREMARMLVLDPSRGELEHREVRDWPSLVPDGALVVLNDTRVVKARLLGEKSQSGGKAEILLVEPLTDDDGASSRWRAIGKGLGRLQGQTLVFGAGALTAVVDGPSSIAGLFDVTVAARSGSVATALGEHGHVPVPPYIRRADDDADVERYQTVYARTPGAIAAPTAGLHLTDEMLIELRRRDVQIGYLTLHVGLGTFQPVSVEDIDDHPMHDEWMHIPTDLARAIGDARTRGAPVVAVGTTVVRALEAAADPEREGHVVAVQRKTNLLLQPGHRFCVVDALLTNFHLPRSTLLALVSAFAGRERVLGAYREAVSAGYRFFSYGDAMWIPRAAPPTNDRRSASRAVAEGA
jgi:S-adenosylmethionine:tRNA ribosyltransferase-isomerase